MSPKISAGSVKEHHSLMFSKIVDAAEQILRSEGPHDLTAGAVARRAGIARNSIYRYVESVDELRIHVLERYVPGWLERMDAVLDASDSPVEQLQGIVRLSLQIGAESGHRWLIEVMRAGRGRGKPVVEYESNKELQNKSTVVLQFHQHLAQIITELWQQIESGRRADRSWNEVAAVNARLTVTMLNTGLSLIDAGRSADVVTASLETAIAALVRA